MQEKDNQNSRQRVQLNNWCTNAGKRQPELKVHGCQRAKEKGMGEDKRATWYPQIWVALYCDKV